MDLIMTEEEEKRFDTESRRVILAINFTEYNQVLRRITNKIIWSEPALRARDQNNLQILFICLYKYYSEQIFSSHSSSQFQKAQRYIKRKIRTFGEKDDYLIDLILTNIRFFRSTKHFLSVSSNQTMQTLQKLCNYAFLSGSEFWKCKPPKELAIILEIIENELKLRFPL